MAPTVLGVKLMGDGIDRWATALDACPPYMLWVQIDARGDDQFTPDAKWAGMVYVNGEDRLEAYSLVSTDRIYKTAEQCAVDVERILIVLLATSALIARRSQSLAEVAKLHVSLADSWRRTYEGGK